MKVLVDMNLSPRWIERLIKAKIEAIHWSAVGSPCAPDSELMSFAAANDYVVLTHDLDFSAILAVTQGLKPSVVQIRSSNIDVDAVSAAVIDALLQAERDLALGALLTVDPKRTRMRLLPLR